jgi:hypothetical protein
MRNASSDAAMKLTDKTATVTSSGVVPGVGDRTEGFPGGVDEPVRKEENGLDYYQEDGDSGAQAGPWGLCFPLLLDVFC